MLVMKNSGLKMGAVRIGATDRVRGQYINAALSLIQFTVIRAAYLYVFMMK